MSQIKTRDKIYARGDRRTDQKRDRHGKSDVGCAILRNKALSISHAGCVTAILDKCPIPFRFPSLWQSPTIYHRVGMEGRKGQRRRETERKRQRVCGSRRLQGKKCGTSTVAFTL